MWWIGSNIKRIGKKCEFWSDSGNVNEVEIIDYY